MCARLLIAGLNSHLRQRSYVTWHAWLHPVYGPDGRRPRGRGRWRFDSSVGPGFGPLSTTSPVAFGALLAPLHICHAHVPNTHPRAHTMTDSCLVCCRRLRPPLPLPPPPHLSPPSPPPINGRRRHRRGPFLSCCARSVCSRCDKSLPQAFSAHQCAQHVAARPGTHVCSESCFAVGSARRSYLRPFRAMLSTFLVIYFFKFYCLSMTH